MDKIKNNWMDSNIAFRNLRHKSGFTLREVEAKTGISNAYLSQLETGKVNNPSFRIAIKLLNVYGVPLVSPEIANKLIKVRDAIIEKDIPEAYHQLCLVADQDLKNNEHWEKLENLAIHGK